jgi:hypothetical protein
MWRKGEKRRGQGRAHSAMLVAGRKERAGGGKERKRKRRVGHVERALRLDRARMKRPDHTARPATKA